MFRPWKKEFLKGKWHEVLFDAYAILSLFKYLIKTLDLSKKPLESLIALKNISYFHQRRKSNAV